MKGASSLPFFEKDNASTWFRFDWITPIPKEYQSGSYLPGSPESKWRYENWGCPGFGWNVMKLDDNTIAFITPWWLPDKIAAKLSRMYGGTKVVLVSQDESDHKAYQFTFENGEESETTEPEDEYVQIMKDNYRWYEYPDDGSDEW